MTDSHWDEAFALARLRAAGRLVHPDDEAAMRSLRANAGRAGRTIVETAVSARRMLLLGWQAGEEPVSGSDTGVIRHGPSATVLLTFAACLRACWPDRDDEPYPGSSSTDTYVLAVMAALTQNGITEPEARPGGAEGYHKRALSLLRSTALLDPASDAVRLGPAVALWPASDLLALRRVHDQLPALPEGGEPVR